MKLSKHSKLRMKERLSLNKKEMEQFYKEAMKHGKCVSRIKDDRIKKYLAPKQKYNSRVKLYKNYVFIFSKNSKQLYTMYKLPDELIESEVE